MTYRGVLQVKPRNPVTEGYWTMPKFTIEPGVKEPLVPGRMNDRFLLTLESDQLAAIDKRADEAGLSRNAYARKALYHFMNCQTDKEAL